MIQKITSEEYNRLVINSISDKYPKIRQKSKAPTFALQYQGTWMTLHKNVGMSIEQAKQVEEAYHTLYTISDMWLQQQLAIAEKLGYATLAFGLKIRTKYLNSYNPNHINLREQERRTIGNALSQSYCMLTDRCANEFLDRVDNANLSDSIIPINKIHDSTYYLVRNNLGIFSWFYNNLIECIEWQEDPKLVHDTVKLRGDICIYYPNWANEIKLNKDKMYNKPLKEIKEYLNEIFRW